MLKRGQMQCQSTENDYKGFLCHATRSILSNIVQFRTGPGLLGKHFITTGAHQVTCNCGDEQEKTLFNLQSHLGKSKIVNSLTDGIN